MRQRRVQRGLSLLEVILGLAVMATAGLVMLSVFSSSTGLAVGDRNRSLAILMAENMIEDVHAHPYGAAAPDSWPLTEQAQTFMALVEGAPQQTVFHRQMRFENGSFIGNGTQSSDVAYITVSWDETLPPHADATKWKALHTINAQEAVLR